MLACFTCCISVVLKLLSRTGVGHKPALDLSFQEHDFGTCFVKQAGIEAAQRTLRLTNNDTSDLSFEIESVTLITTSSSCLGAWACVSPAAYMNRV